MDEVYRDAVPGSVWQMAFAGASWARLARRTARP
jgi:hypothetical protein